MKLFPQFPPAFKGLAAGPANPRTVAIAQARRGVDAGLLVWSATDERLMTALVLAPDVPLEKAVACLPACAVATRNAFGTLAPPETAVHLEWSGGIRLNGGLVGTLRLSGPTCGIGEIPDWLVVSLELDLEPQAEREPGETPDRTALSQEGCGNIGAMDFIETWAAHCLYWLNTLETDPKHRDLSENWAGLAWHSGNELRLSLAGKTVAGKYLGVDEDFGLLLKNDRETCLLPLTDLLEEG